MTTKELIRRFGLPYYMKVDVEGADKHVLPDLAAIEERPPVISAEEYGVECIDALLKAGYSKFQVVPQSTKGNVMPPSPR